MPSFVEIAERMSAVRRPLGVGKEDSGKRRQPARKAKSRRARKGDGSKKTNTAVFHPVTDASEGKGRLIMMLGIWRQG